MKTWDELTKTERKFQGELAYNLMLIDEITRYHVGLLNLTEILPWTAALDEDDRAEFFDDWRGALQDARETGDMTEVRECLSDWRNTAEVLSDPIAREILLGHTDLDRDFVEVHRPGSEN